MTGIGLAVVTSLGRGMSARQCVTASAITPVVSCSRYTRARARATSAHGHARLTDKAEINGHADHPACQPACHQRYEYVTV